MRGRRQLAAERLTRCRFLAHTWSDAHSPSPSSTPPTVTTTKKKSNVPAPPSSQRSWSLTSSKKGNKANGKDSARPLGAVGTGNSAKQGDAAENVLRPSPLVSLPKGLSDHLDERHTCFLSDAERAECTKVARVLEAGDFASASSSSFPGLLPSFHSASIIDKGKRLLRAQMEQLMRYRGNVHSVDAFSLEQSMNSAVRDVVMSAGVAVINKEKKKAEGNPSPPLEQLAGVSKEVSALLCSLERDAISVVNKEGQVHLRTLPSAELTDYCERRLRVNDLSSGPGINSNTENNVLARKELVFRCQASLLCTAGLRPQNPNDPGMEAWSNYGFQRDRGKRRKYIAEYLKRRSDALGRAMEVSTFVVSSFHEDKSLVSHPMPLDQPKKDADVAARVPLAYVAADALLCRGLGFSEEDELMKQPQGDKQHQSHDLHNTKGTIVIEEALKRLIGAMKYEWSWPHADDVLEDEWVKKMALVYTWKR